MTPRPGESKLHNLVSTLLLHGNGSHTLDLARIAKHQNMDVADLTDAFARAETALSLTPRNCETIESE